jgi:hypothetical protein
VPTPIPKLQLHLPELYSGSPWGKLGNDPWIAFVTLNPSIDSKEEFPTLEHFRDAQNRGQIDPLISFFNNRFCSPANESPIQHGRHDQRIVWWKKNPPHGSTPRSQPTWQKIEDALRECVAGTCWADPPIFLGRIAAITDAVPWKFAKWVVVPKPVKKELLEAGACYLRSTLLAHPPKAIVACGSDFKSLPKGHFLYDPRRVMIGHRSVPCFNVTAPTARPTKKNPHEPFLVEMRAIKEELLRALCS